MVKYLAKGYLWALLLLLYSPILIIMIFSFTEAKVLGNWTGFSTKLYSSLFAGNVQHSLVSALWNTFAIAMIAATVSTLLGSVAAIGIFNLKARARNAVSFVNNTPMLNPDYMKVASAYDIPSKRVFTREELKEAITEMLATDGPFLLEACVVEEGNVLPMTPPGGSVNQMLLEC